MTLLRRLQKNAVQCAINAPGSGQSTADDADDALLRAMLKVPWEEGVSMHAYFKKHLKDNGLTNRLDDGCDDAPPKSTLKQSAPAVLRRASRSRSRKGKGKGKGSGKWSRWLAR